jgi:serine/threonine protein kinase
MTDLAGELFGNYRLVRQVGHGGFADVYLGTHVYLQTQAAIKILQVQFANDALEGFLSEARTVIQLEHPHIVRILECGVERKLPFLVMNYAPGGSLRQRYRTGTRMPLERISQYIGQAASALHYAHERKLIHRDIKPENMLLSQNDALLLSDFGLVLHFQSTNAQTIQEMAGTVSYMAPEQLQGKPQPASDQYALGIVAYEWVSGERPFHGSFVEVASQHVLAPPPSLYGRVPGLSREIEQVIFTALAKNAADRFPSVQTFADALAKAIVPALSTREAIAPDATPSSLISTFTPFTPSLQVASSPERASSSLFASTSGSASAQSTDVISQSSADSVQSTTWRNRPGSQFASLFNQSLPTPDIEKQRTAPVSAVSQSGISTFIREVSPNLLPIRAEPIVPNDVLPVANQANVPRTSKRRRTSLVIAAGALVLILILLLVLGPSFLPKARQAPGVTSSHVGQTSVAVTTTAGQPDGAKVLSGTATPTDSRTPQASSTPSQTASTLSVTSVTASVDHSSYHGTCSTPLPLTFTGTIRVASGSSGGTVSYNWLRSDNSKGPVQTVTFSPQDVTKTVTTTWQGPTSTGSQTLWEALEIISPNAMTSQHANAQFVCDPPAPVLTVTGVTATSTGRSGAGCSPPTFYMSATITLAANSPAGVVTYTWVRSDGSKNGPLTVSVAAGQQQVVVNDSWTAPGIGPLSYWARVDVSSPNAISSNQVSFTGFVCMP